MGSRRLSAEHQEAAARRLAQLEAELSAVAADGTPWWGEHTRSPDDRPRLHVVDVDDTAEIPPVRWDPPEDLDPRVPHPGRHASRRSREWSSSVWAETWRDRARLGAGQLAVVAVVVAGGLGLTAWWVVRGDAEPARAPAALQSEPSASPLVEVSPAASPAASSAASPAPPAAPASLGPVTVDVAGKVRRPGIAVLDSGARVVDALEAAGGARRGVDLTALNLARVLVDGEQIVVGEPAPAGVAAAAVPGPTATGAPPIGTLVDLNTATEADLDTLPEVGPVTAGSILAWRDAHGGFTAVDELLEIDGIGETTLARIAPYVTV